MIFESHAHYDDKKFDKDRDELLLSLKDHNVGTVINIGADLAGLRRSVVLSKKYDFMYAAVGIHPSEIDEISEDVIDEMIEDAKLPKTVAIGEIGLDYYWEKTPEGRQKQKLWFKRQLEVSYDVDLPVVIHSRDAAKDTFDILKEEASKGLRAVIHCYSNSPEMADEYKKMGYFFGIGGVVTYKNAQSLKESVRRIPIEQILLETDSPYLTPEPHRGKRNDSTYLPLVVKEIARLKGISEQEVIDITEANAKRLFTKVV